MEINFVIAMTVMLLAAVITYAIQYGSVISPGYVEFDDRLKKELKLMVRYNKIMDGCFICYAIIISIIALTSIFAGKIQVLTLGLYIQVGYFVISFVLMLYMYVRSRLYWARDSRRIKKIEREGNDDRIIFVTY